MPAAADVERPMQALLDLIATERARQCGQLLGEARARAAAVRGQAHDDARRRMRLAFAEQRRLRSEAEAAALARLATHRRLHEQRRTAALLALARERLPEALRGLWHDADSREAWVARTLTAARKRLPRAGWQIAHAPGWPAAERDAARDALAQGGIAAAFAAAPDIAAGLKVAAGGSVVDATLDGLLAARAEIEARLLRLLEQGP